MAEKVRAGRTRSVSLSDADEAFFDSYSFSPAKAEPPAGTAAGTAAGRPEVRLRHPSFERQRSVEYLDLENTSLPPAACLTPPGSASNLDTAGKKIKKKRHFFHRYQHRDKHKSELDQKLDRSLPAYTQHSNSHENSPAALSLDSTWKHGAWAQLDPKKSSSVHSSNASLLSVESESRELSDEELVESLVNPRGRHLAPSATPPPPFLEHSVSLAETEGNTAGVEYCINVTLMSGHNLAVRDRTGTSDPYVKFKCPPFKYRSAVVHRNLNPEWREHFSFRTHDLFTPMIIRVFDHDYGSLDDFMGGQTVDLSAYAIGEQHIVDLGLVDTTSPKTENLGFIRLFLKITLGADVETVSKEDKKQKSCATKVWNSVLTVTLLEGSNLPAMDQNGLSDPYCKFKLGSQKYKSKTQSKTLDPKWMQRFDMLMYDDCSTLHIEVWDKDFPQNDDFIGLCSVDLLTLPRDVTHNYTLPLLSKDNEIVSEDCTIHFSLCITGNKIAEESELDTTKAAKNYSLLRSLDIRAIKEKNIGHLCLTIDRVVDLLPCNCFVLVELGNSCVKTQTVSKAANPEWNKAFHFVVGDIHDELEISVYKAGSRSDHLLGRVRIPLHRLKQGPQHYALKNKHCLERSRGVLYIETTFVYNPVRAMVRTINPREVKMLEAEQKFKKKVLMDNIKRVSNLARTILSSVEFIERTWSWENKALSFFSLLAFVTVTLFGELWMPLFGGAILFLYQFLAVYIRGDHIWQKKVSSQIHMLSSISKTTSMEDDSDFSDNIEDKHTSLREKFRQFQEILVMVQNILGMVADAEEGVKNLLNWQVPFLSWMAILVFLGGTIVLYWVPLRYVILIWGINKYTKRLRKPNYIPNNELLDFLSRCPTNKQLQQWNELPLAVYNKPADMKVVRVENTSTTNRKAARKKARKHK